MGWIIPALAIAGAVKGNIDARQAKRQAAEHDNFRKRVLANSAWHNMGDPGAAQVGNTNMMSGMLGGAAQGALIGTAFGQGNAAAGAAGAASQGQDTTLNLSDNPTTSSPQVSSSGYGPTVSNAPAPWLSMQPTYNNPNAANTPNMAGYYQNKPYWGYNG